MSKLKKTITFFFLLFSYQKVSKSVESIVVVKIYYIFLPLSLTREKTGDKKIGNQEIVYLFFDVPINSYNSSQYEAFSLNSSLDLKNLTTLEPKRARRH